MAFYATASIVSYKQNSRFSLATFYAGNVNTPP
jgi:hypothetical protein